MSPLEICVLLYYYARPGSHPEEYDTPCGADAIDSLVTNGLIRPDNGHYCTTPRGNAHVQQLCTTPWPVQAWVGADGKIIEVVS